MIALVLLTACLDPYAGGDSDDPVTPIPTVVETLGPEGGTIAVGEATLVVPAGALVVPVEIVIRDTGEAPPAPYEGLSTVWSFEPHGLAFSAPVEVTLPYAPADARGLLFWSNDEGGYDAIEATVADGRATALVEHFSTAFVAVPPVVELEFTAPYPPADVVVVVDDSCSMSEEQGQLADQMGALVAPLLGSGLDVHLGVITTDIDTSPQAAGRLRAAGGHRYLTPATPDPEAVFAQMVNAGTNGSPEEKGRGALYTLIELRPDVPGNVDFTRDDATLTAIFLSDEEDQSGATPIDLADFGVWFTGLKARPADAVAHAIAWLPGTNCATGSTVGAQYAGYANATGGERVNLCAADWTAGLNAMVDRLWDSARVMLPEVPLEAPEVELEVAGAPQLLDPAQYTWDPASLTVYFDQGVRPGADDVVRVRYRRP